MSWDYCEMPEFYSESYQVAKKMHRCAECRTAINPGERYIACRGKWDGEFQVFKQHEVCLEACLAAREYMSDECVPFGGLMEWYREDPQSKKHWTPRLRKAMAGVLWKRRSNPTYGEKR